MFVCRTRTRSRDGQDYFTFRLVRSQRVGPKVRQRTLLNLGGATRKRSATTARC